MADPIISMIERWFAAPHDDGEFGRYGREVPYTVVGPENERGHVLFTTKPASVVAALSKHKGFSDIAIVGRNGLPNLTDVAWIRALAGRRPLSFLGDMDAADLMIFAWLRAQIHPKRIGFLGINDRLLSVLPKSVPDSHYIPCEASERESISLLGTAFPDFRETLGRNCCDVLNKGFKLELEAIILTRRNASAIVQVVTKAGREENFSES